MPQARPTTTKAEASSIPQSTAPVEVRPELGTAGRTEPDTELRTPTQNPSPQTLDEDVVVRQAIQRFEGTYQSRWGGLGFEHCDINRDEGEAAAICIPREATESSSVQSDRVWKFSLRKADGAWKIVSVQPPPNSPQ